jgi:hypothetical protein
MLQGAISMNIYSPIPITEQIKQSFKPCRLYIKELAGIKYFGKTSRDPYTYNGSGKMWKDRIKKYGKDNIKTLWVSEWFYDPQQIHDYALNFSEENRIVESNDWANLQAENGIAGGRFVNPGYKGAGRKGYITKKLKGVPTGGTKESLARAIKTKREKGISIIKQLITPAALAKSKETCNNLANRPIVEQLRLLAKQTKTKLGSGWVRKPDHWILTMINDLSSSRNVKSSPF